MQKNKFALFGLCITVALAYPVNIRFALNHAVDATTAIG
jgi:hypothetical protein